MANIYKIAGTGGNGFSAQHQIQTGAQGSNFSAVQSMSQHALTNLSAASFNWNNNISLEEALNPINPNVKKYQVMEITEDLLALSCAWYRIRQSTKQGQPYTNISKLTDKELFNRVTEEDRTSAAKIRDYYSKKLMMWKLKGQALSKFREDMNSFIHSEGKIFKEDMCPLAYRLPEFYHYDVSFDELANEHNKIIKERNQGIETKSLRLQKTFMVNKKHSAKRKEYWFSDQNDNLVTLSLMHDNPLLSLLDLASQMPINVTAKFNIRERDNVQYMYGDKYTFS